MLRKSLRRRRLRASGHGTMNRPGRVHIAGRSFPRTGVDASACTTLLEITSVTAAAARPSIMHACTQMCPHFLTKDVVKDLSACQVLLVLLSKNEHPCAAAMVQWSAQECYVKYICASVKSSGRLLFHYIMCICGERGLSGLRLVAIPQLVDMYTTWGHGSVVASKSDMDVGMFVFSVAAYLGYTAAPRVLAEMGVSHIVLEKE